MPKNTKTALKNLKKQIARKKMNRKNIIIAIIFVIIAAGAAAGWFTFGNKNKDAETYSAGGQTIRLFPDGNFTANLAHNTNKSGTYARIEEGGRILLVFTESNGAVSEGSIQNNRLHIPSQWDDGHGHGNILSRVDSKVGLVD